MILGLYGRAALAADAGVTDSTSGFAGIALAYNGRDKAEVDAVLAEAVAAGGTLVKAAEDVFWFLVWAANVAIYIINRSNW